MVNNAFTGSLTISVSSSTYGNNSLSYGTIITNNSGSYTWGPPANHNPPLHVKGDAEFDGDIKVKGRSLLKFLEDIETRLAIMQPDPAKLEKYEALRKAYQHYKLMEKLVGEE